MPLASQPLPKPLLSSIHRNGLKYKIIQVADYKPTSDKARYVNKRAFFGNLTCQ
jgi:hypothetical protein